MHCTNSISTKLVARCHARLEWMGMVTGCTAPRDGDWVHVAPVGGGVAALRSVAFASLAGERNDAAQASLVVEMSCAVQGHAGGGDERPPLGFTGGYEEQRRGWASPAGKRTGAATEPSSRFPSSGRPPPQMSSLS